MRECCPVPRTSVEREMRGNDTGMYGPGEKQMIVSWPAETGYEDLHNRR